MLTLIRTEKHECCWAFPSRWYLPSTKEIGDRRPPWVHQVIYRNRLAFRAGGTCLASCFRLDLTRTLLETQVTFTFKASNATSPDMMRRNVSSRASSSSLSRETRRPRPHHQTHPELPPATGPLPRPARPAARVPDAVSVAAAAAAATACCSNPSSSRATFDKGQAGEN